MRKPVQIVATSVDHRETVALFALCDDGSMWVAEANKQNEKWIRLSDIPQDEPEQERQSYVRMSADEVGVLLNIAVAAHRVVAKYDAGERPVNVESLRARLSALGRDWIEAHGELEQPATSPDVVKALRYLEKCERQYREMHDTLGSGHIRTGHAWDQMRAAGDAAREVLKRIDEQEEPR